MRIDERIAHHHDALSPQERRAAATLLEHLNELGTYRAAELATLAGVSKATMSRLFRSLGFADFDEVRAHLRALRTAGEPRRVDGAPDLDAHAATESEALVRALRQSTLTAAVETVADARRVLVAGWRNSHPVALHLRQQLAQARPDVRLGPVPGQVMGEELADLSTRDVVVAIGFRRRPNGFAAFVEESVATGAALVLLTDPTGLRLAPRATVWLECQVQSSLAFDSYAAAMGLVGVLADGVLSRRGRAGRDRVGAISRTYERLAELGD